MAVDSETYMAVCGEVQDLRRQLANSEARVAELEAERLKLPHDVVINRGMTFRKGVALKVFVKAAERWHRQAMDRYKSVDGQELRRAAGLEAGKAGGEQCQNS